MFVFLILHFMATKDTMECINSILDSIDYEEKRIIVVDNGSNNDSFMELKETYENNPIVVLLRSEENLGFARGNNIGFKYAKNYFNPSFIAMINNDTIIDQQDFCKITINKYNTYQFSVLGPDIITKDGIHQNPWIRDGMSYKQLKIFRIKQKFRILLSFIKLDKYVYRIIHNSDSRIIGKQGDILDVPLHGAALVFSEKYIKTHDGLDDRTFLYFEEEILRSHCKNENLLMMYSSDLQIFHKEDVATKMIAKKPGIKERNEYKNRIESSKKYEELKRELGEKV